MRKHGVVSAKVGETEVHLGPASTPDFETAVKQLSGDREKKYDVPPHYIKFYEQMGEDPPDFLEKKSE